MAELMALNAKLEKFQVVYIAKKFDEVDQKLAKFLKTYPDREKLNILFLRES